MMKQDFITNLEQSLLSLSSMEKEHALNFYNETIEDRIEDGMSEEEAIASLGSMEDIVAQVLSQSQEQHANTQVVQERKNHRTLRIVVLVVSSPLWSMMLLAAFSLYLSLWGLLMGIVILIVCLAIFMVMGLWNLVPILHANVAAGVVMIGSLLLVLGVLPMTCWGLKKGVLWMKEKTGVWCRLIMQLFVKVVS